MSAKTAKPKTKRRTSTADDAPRLLKVEDGTVARWYIMGAIVQDARSRMIHAQIAWPILEAYFSKYGKGRASYRYLAKATGLTHGSISTATADLVNWGYFTREVGGGKAATTYIPNWEFAAEVYAAGPLGVLQPPSALQPQSALPLPSVLPSQNACVLPSPSATDDSVLQPQNESLLDVPLKAGLIKRDSPAALSGGLAAPASVEPDLKKMTIRDAGIDEDGGDGLWVFIDLEGDDGTPGRDYFEIETGDVATEVIDGSPATRFAQFYQACSFIGHAERMEELRGRTVWVAGEPTAYSFYSERDARNILAGNVDSPIAVDAPSWAFLPMEPYVTKPCRLPVNMKRPWGATASQGAGQSPWPV
jgi:hypothetical protein